MISWQLTLLQTLRVCPRCRRLLSIHEIQHGRIITAPARLQPLRATGAPWQGAGGASGAGQGGRSRGAGGGHTGEQVKKEGAGLPGIGCLLGQSRARPSWRVPTPPAMGPILQNSAANNNFAAGGYFQVCRPRWQAVCSFAPTSWVIVSLDSFCSHVNPCPT